VSVSVGSAYLEIIPSARGFSSKLQGQVGSSVAGVGKSAGDKAGKSFGSAFGGRVKAIIGATAALAVGGSAVSFLKDSISEARESQKVGALTAQVIKTTGGAANVTAKQIGNLSTAISNKTGIDDEQVQSGANMLLTFKNIRNEAGKNNKIFDQATSITTDMAAAMAAASGGQIDLKSSSIQVGKALNDPVKGITALSRVGVTFTEQQKKQIKALVASGDTLGAQKMILKELKSEFGGAAAATATNGEKMSVAFGNLKEQIGTALLPTIDKIQKALVENVIPAISKFFSEMQSGTGTGGKVAEVLGKIVDVLRFMGSHIKVVAGFAAAIVALNVVMAAHALSLTIAELGLKGYLLQTKIGAAMSKAFAAVQWLVNAALAANPIGLVVIALVALTAGLVIAYKKSETFRKIVDGAFRGIAAAASFMWDNVIKPIFRFWLNTWFTVIGAMVNGAAKAFGWVPGIGGKLKAAADKFNGFRDDVNRALDGIHSVKEIHLKVTTQQLVLNPSLNKPRVVGATGGIVTRPTVALIGEAGPEAVVPLNRTPGSSPLPATAGSGVDSEQATYRAVSRALAERQTVIMSKPDLDALDLMVGAG
jgi:hypothetical protein